MDLLKVHQTQLPMNTSKDPSENWWARSLSPARCEVLGPPVGGASPRASFPNVSCPQWNKIILWNGNSISIEYQNQDQTHGKFIKTISFTNFTNCYGDLTVESQHRRSDWQCSYCCQNAPGAIASVPRGRGFSASPRASCSCCSWSWDMSDMFTILGDFP